MSEGVIVIKQGKEKPIHNKHPWVFSGAIRRVDHDPQPGEIVQVVDERGGFLARGYYNPTSQINVRLLTWEDEPINEAWWRHMLRRAIAGRIAQQEAFGAGEYNAVRLVNAENDYLPGLVVDRYGGWLVLQALTLGIDVRKHEIAAILADILQPQGIYERSDVDVRQKEGLREVAGLLWGDEPPEVVEIEENTLRFPVDIRGGHKTGFYLDQRENRGWLHDLLYFNMDEQEDDERRVLNVFSYTGGFGLYALAAGVREVVNVDTSVPALELAEAIVTANFRDEAVAFWRKHFRGAELPLAFFFSDEEGYPQPERPVNAHICMVGQLARVRRNGETLAFSADTFGCFGGKRYAGYACELAPTFRYFLSTGIEGRVEGERYKKTPEMVDEFVAAMDIPKARAKYLVFKRIDKLDDGDEPLVVVSFATPDVLSGLFTLANFGTAEHAVVTPFAAGCGTFLSHPLAEAERDAPRAVIGMFDVSARPYVPPDVLSFAAPLTLFRRMVAEADESFLTTPSWERVAKRLPKVEE